MDGIVIGVVIIYLLAMLGIGYWASKQIKSNEDFMVAGRRLGPIMLAGALAATEVGGGSSLGVTEKAYGAWGLSAAWYVLTMTVTFLILTFIAPKLRSAMVKTVPEYFYKRYGKANGFVTAIIMLLPMIGLTAIQLMASATVLSVMTGWSYTISVLIVTVVVTAYSIVGGLWSVTVTDFVQWILIVVGSALVIPFGLEAAGGWSNVVSHLPAEKLSFTEGIGWKTIISLILMYTASFAVGQEAVQRYYAAKDERSAKLGSVYAALVYVLYAFVPAVIGLIAYSLVQMGNLDPTFIEANGTRYVLPTMAAQLLPSALVGLLFAALISATMSSADSNLLAAGSIFSNDLYKHYINKDATDRQVLVVTRWAMVVVAILSLGVALLDFQDMITVLMFSFTLRAGGAFIPYVIGHYWRKASAISSMGAVITGSLVVILVERGHYDFFGFDSSIPGVLASAVVFFVLANIFPNKNATIE